MLELSRISVSLTGTFIIKDLSLRVSPGEFVCIIGNNGAGKSTLLRAMSGEQKITSGCITINGKNMADMPVKALAKIRAVLPQQVELNFRLLVDDVVRLGRQPFDQGDVKGEEYTQHSLELSECKHLQGRDYTQLSGGEQQRVQLARVFNQTFPRGALPQYLLVDECTSSLDITHQHLIFKQLKQQAADEKLGVVAVVHDLNLAARYASTIAVLQRGKLKALGSPNNVMRKELIDAVFDVDCVITRHPTHRHPVILAA